MRDGQRHVVWSRWSAGVAAAAFLAVLAIYLPTFLSMVRTWIEAETFAHGVLILPIVLYLIWHQREELATIPVQPAPLGLLPLAGFALLWFAGRLVDVLVVQQFALVGMLSALCLTLFGTRCTRAVAFPLAYLVFAVPFGEGLVLPLMEFTADFTVKAVQLTGVAVYREGFYLSLPSGDFEVAKACSGIRYLIASVALGSLYAYLTYHSYVRRALFMVLAIVVPIVANGIRAYGIVMLAHLSDMQIAVGVDHLIYGWIFFGVIMFLMFWLGSLFRDKPAAEPPAEVTAAPSSQGPPARNALVLLPAGIVVLLAAPLGFAWLQSPQAENSPARAQLALGVGEWQGPLPSPTDWTPVFHGATDILRGQYREDGEAVRVFLASYWRQEQGGELISEANHLYDPNAWTRVGVSTREVRLPSGAVREVIATDIRTFGAQLLLWHWYQIDGRRTVSKPVAKLLEASSRLRGGGGSVVIAIAAPHRGQPEQGEPLLTAFLAAHDEALRACASGRGAVGQCAQ